MGQSVKGIFISIHTSVNVAEWVRIIGPANKGYVTGEWYTWSSVNCFCWRRNSFQNSFETKPTGSKNTTKEVIVSICFIRSNSSCFIGTGSLDSGMFSLKEMAKANFVKNLPCVESQRRCPTILPLAANVIPKLDKLIWRFSSFGKDEFSSTQNKLLGFSSHLLVLVSLEATVSCWQIV